MRNFFRVYFSEWKSLQQLSWRAEQGQQMEFAWILWNSLTVLNCVKYDKNKVTVNLSKTWSEVFKWLDSWMHIWLVYSWQYPCGDMQKKLKKRWENLKQSEPAKKIEARLRQKRHWFTLPPCLYLFNSAQTPQMLACSPLTATPAQN